VDDYLAVNRASWDELVPAHVASPGYAVRQFARDPGFLSYVVRFDLPLLGDVTGLRGVHLQCHIGTDTISLARLGASMTGLDFSGPAVEAARRLASDTGTTATFAEADVYTAPDVLGSGEFDLVYCSIGTLCWLPDVRRWARVVSALLRPGGRLFMRDGHPVLHSLDDESGDGLLVVGYPYFETQEPLVSDDASTDAVVGHGVTHQWNHGIGELVTALLDAGLTLTGLTEHDSIPWNALPGMVEQAGGEWRLAGDHRLLPLTYTIQAVRQA